MTLKDLLFKISKMAKEQKCINYAAAGTSLYQLNPKNIENYPVLFLSPTGNHLIEENTITYDISLYYFDRLLEDFSNDIDIYSAAIEQLKNIINGIGTIEGILKVETGYSVSNFSDTESFDDSLAGAYTTIQIVTTNEELCYE